jgi:LysR family glycine cleavage system transcriptional activator
MHIPSTQALRALDSFARLGSVWQAAEELRLTRSAVSHQLRLLEKELGFELLRRRGKGIALTPLGRRYATDVRKALLIIRDASTQYGEVRISGSLRVNCSSGLASLWLAPRIGEFQEMFPDIALSIETPSADRNVGAGDADVFIAFGDGNWPDWDVERLREVHIAPVCSPALLTRLGGLAEPAELFRATLLHHVNFDNWMRWFAEAAAAPQPMGGIVFGDFNLAIAAAVAGQGIALGDPMVCGSALDQGQLVRPFDIGVSCSRSYYLVIERQKLEQPTVVAFCEWLKSRLALSDGRGYLA